MAANALQDGNGIFSSIRWDSCWPSWSLLPTCLTAMGHGNCSDEAADSAGNCVSSGLTAPIAALCRDGLRSDFVFAFNQSSARKSEKGFSVLPRHWVVERTFAWLGLNRRLCKDYERLPESSVAFIHIAMIRPVVRRLAPN